MRDNDEVIRHKEYDKDYVDPDKHQENMEYYKPAQYKENFVKNYITDDEEVQIPHEIQL